MTKITKPADPIEQPAATAPPRLAPVVEPEPEASAPAPEPSDAKKTLDALHAADAVEPEPAPVREQFSSRLKLKVRDTLAAQDYRGAPSFEDLKAVADAIIDGLAEEGL